MAPFSVSVAKMASKKDEPLLYLYDSMKLNLHYNIFNGEKVTMAHKYDQQHMIHH